MTIASYLFQSPYSSPVQVGRPDPAAQKSESQSTQESPVLAEQKQLPAESSVKPTLGGGVSISLTALEGNAQTTASDFKSLSSASQAQKAYVDASTF